MSDDEKLNKLYMEMYIGEGRENPPMIVRMDRVETALATGVYYARIIIGLLVSILVASLMKFIIK